MKRLRTLILAIIALVLARRGRRREKRAERIVPAAGANPRAEMVIIVLLFAAALSAAGFVVVYGFDRLGNRTQLLGLALGLAFALVAAALITMGKLLVATEEKEEDYPDPGDRQEEAAIEQIVHEAGTPVTRKKLLATAGTAAGGALAVAAITPALSFGPWVHTDALYRTPWRRGRRLVDADGRPLSADDIGESFYTAYPEGAGHDDIAAPVVVVRVDPSSLQLPPGRAGWAPEGILAFSKICTHAGCAIALYRKPKFSPVQPRPALICPCHYSTFDPAQGAAVTFGPAGRALPQLPLAIDPARALRAAGNFSAPPGPSWAGVRRKGAQS